MCACCSMFPLSFLEGLEQLRKEHLFLQNGKRSADIWAKAFVPFSDGEVNLVFLSEKSMAGPKRLAAWRFRPRLTPGCKGGR